MLVAVLHSPMEGEVVCSNINICYLLMENVDTYARNYRPH